MNRYLAITAAVLSLTFPPPARGASPLDGSAPFVCTSTEIRECEHGRGCLRVEADDINLPALIRVDAKQKALTGLGEAGRTAPIHNLEKRDGRLVMYGGQEGRGWTVIVEAGGRMSAAVVDDRVSVVVFGACAVP
jgi:hypothetical protein